ncbi:hypothetical protein BU16DRAFT_531208 [Lophium mytilinum]|uniref:Uncharacterized protein n=1 Tax=Lophium mytilinum TaxID=390894 RepID=A0A6A6QCG4_9PEZI|nr:hypothetical protein BU16DRAFT_531208 [Lophium mytilinum]
MASFSLFTFIKGAADAAVGAILLIKPAVIYHSAFSKALSESAGLPLPNLGEEARSAQHAVAIMVAAVGLAHVRASFDRASLPPFILLNALWSAFALSTVMFAPQRATSALLMTGINHFVFSTGMWWWSGFSVPEILGFGGVAKKRRAD